MALTVNIPSRLRNQKVSSKAPTAVTESAAHAAIHCFRVVLYSPFSARALRALSDKLPPTRIPETVPKAVGSGRKPDNWILIQHSKRKTGSVKMYHGLTLLNSPHLPFEGARKNTFRKEEARCGAHGSSKEDSTTVRIRIDWDVAICWNRRDGL